MILSVMAAGVMSVPIIWGELAFGFGIVATAGIFYYFTKRM